MPDFIVEIALTVASLCLLLFSMCTHPRSYTCAPGYHNMGIRPSGQFCCYPAPVGDPEHDGTNGPDLSIRKPWAVCGQIWCKGGSVPIAANDRVLRCSR